MSPFLSQGGLVFCRHALFSTCALAVWALDLTDRGLYDNPVEGDIVTYLSGERGTSWTAVADGDSLNIPALVPGDLITDLQRAGKMGDPWYELNWLTFSSLWANQTWTYRTSFSVPEASLAGPLPIRQLRVVFDGIKMGARVALNGQELGVAESQFLRYSFDISDLVRKDTLHNLEIIFDPTMLVGGRFMACSGGWDWAAYSNTEHFGVRTFSKGIWKHVYLVSTANASASITHVVPQIFYQGEYPTAPLVDGQHGGFRVDVRIFLRAQAASSGDLCLTASWGASDCNATAVDVPAGESVHILSVLAPASDVRLWWPVGMGEQPLFHINVTFHPGSGAGVPIATSRRIGFRYFALVTGNDTDPAYVKRAAAEEGTEPQGMFFRINGAAMWSRGANMIPMEQLEGRMSDEAHRQLVRSAADANMNTLRVWGGGMFLPDAWYDACDEYGVVVYHDMQYAQDGHDPAITDTQEGELRHQVRRLSAHPSIVVWDGCNECSVVMHESTEIYATFVLTVVAEEDRSRAVWPSSPAGGWSKGVRKLDSLPTGNALWTNKGGAIEAHGQYVKGSGFPAVNGNAGLERLNPNLYQVEAAPTGLQFHNTYVSEFGATTMSSFESMSPTLAKEHWGLHAGQRSDTCSGGFASTCTGDNVMAQRNYPCDNFIDAYFGTQPEAYFNTTGEAAFKKQLYQCMLAQALHMKIDIERRRTWNQLGHLAWQLNEIWPTGGWGSLEYGAPVPGQVLGGRWKPLHYLYRRSLFADVITACGLGGGCYIRNDGHRPFEGVCTIEAIALSTGERRALRNLTFDSASPLPAGPATTQFFNISLAGIEPASVVLTFECQTADSPPRIISSHETTLVPPAGLNLLEANISFHVEPEHNKDGSVDVELNTDRTALYVILTTLAQGRFSDNVFAMVPGRRVVQFLPFGMEKADIPTLQSSLRVEHLQPHLQGPGKPGKLEELAV